MKGHTSPLQKHLFNPLCFHLVYFCVESSQACNLTQFVEKANTTKGSDDRTVGNVCSRVMYFYLNLPFYWHFSQVQSNILGSYL